MARAGVVRAYYAHDIEYIVYDIRATGLSALCISITLVYSK